MFCLINFEVYISLYFPWSSVLSASGIGVALVLVYCTFFRDCFRCTFGGSSVFELMLVYFFNGEEGPVYVISCVYCLDLG